MTTYSALTVLPNQEAAEKLAEALEDFTPEPTGVGVFEIEDNSGLWEVGGYFESEPDTVKLALLTAAFGARPMVVSAVPDVDWVAHVKRALSPVVAGRFFVYGSHDADAVPDDAIGLLIEATMAFGTGHHGTTLGCLRAFDRLLDQGFEAQSVADIGCGTAVLAMAAARVFPVVAVASDIDPVAVDVARANVAINDLAGKVACIEAAGFDHPELAKKAPYDLIFANILKGPLIDLAPAMARANRSGGIAILSGILNEQAADVVRVYQENGYNLLHQDQIVDWTTLTLGKE